MQGRLGAGGASIAAAMVFVLLAGCGGGAVSTTPLTPIAPGSATSTLSVATSGGYAALPPVSGITGTVLVPPAIGATAPVSSSVTLSTALPAGVPAPPLTALAYVTFKPNGTMNVPWLPQFSATFPNGAVPAGAQVVWLYYRLGQSATTQSHRQLAQSASSSSTTGWTPAEPAAAAAAGTAGSAGAAGISVGTLAAIGAGVVAVAGIAAAVASSSNGGCGYAECLPTLTPATADVAAGASTVVTATSPQATSYSALVGDCADVNGVPSTSIASVPVSFVQVQAGAAASFTVSGNAAGTCSLAVTSNAGTTSTATIVVGAGAPIQAPSASSFATPSPSPTQTASAAPTSSPAPSPSPSALASPTQSPTAPPSSGGTSGATTATLQGGAFNSFPVPALSGIDASSNISYPAPTSGNSGQTFYITDSLSNFASLPGISGHPTGLLYATITASDGGTVVFPAATGVYATFTGTLFTAGTQYAVAYTINGVTGSPQIVTASTPSDPSDAGAEIDVPTPLSGISLPPDNVIGIVVAR